MQKWNRQDEQRLRECPSEIWQRWKMNQGGSNKGWQYRAEASDSLSGTFEFRGSSRGCGNVFGHFWIDRAWGTHVYTFPWSTKLSANLLELLLHDHAIPFNKLRYSQPCGPASQAFHHETHSLRSVSATVKHTLLSCSLAGLTPTAPGERAVAATNLSTAA